MTSFPLGSSRPLSPSARTPLRRRPPPLPLAKATLLRVIERSGARWTFFDARDVPRIRAEAKHTCFRLPADPDREWWLNDSLDALTERLEPLGFVRIHRAELINLRFLQAVERPRKGQQKAVTVELRDGQRVLVSRRLTGHLRRALASLMQAASDPIGASGAA